MVLIRMSMQAVGGNHNFYFIYQNQVVSCFLLLHRKLLFCSYFHTNQVVSHLLIITV
uniref:Uncharacterized protein n=1 Tax=Arundo donax TaxID=35708 RepID=A0A0A9C7M0_ARUDO